MELLDEFLLSLLSILLALLIGKFASAAVDLGRDSAGRPEIGRKENIGEQSELEERVLSSQVQNRQGTAEAESEVDDSVSEQVSSKGLVKEEVYEFELEEEDPTLAEMRKGEEKLEKVRPAVEEEEKSGIDGKEEGSLLHGEDEWEGIERSELEKHFRVAMEYVGSDNGTNALSELSSDVRKQLFGLRKVATEGPCYEPQPMALKVSARARWHAWQRLGNMNPDAAMEQYISLLSENIPGWMGGNPEVVSKHDKGNDLPDRGISQPWNPDIGSFSLGQPSSETHRISEDHSRIEVESAPTASKVFEKGLTRTFIMDLLSPTRVAFLLLFC